MAKKAAPKAAEPKIAANTGEKASTKPATKTEFYATLAEKTGLSKKQISSVFEAFHELHGKELGKKGPGILTVPSLYKIKVVHKPATKARKAPNPFKPGELMDRPVKPAYNKVKVRALRNLKDMAAK